MHICVCTCVCSFKHTPLCTCGGQGTTLAGLGSLRPPSGFQKSSVNHQAWQQAPLYPPSRLRSPVRGLFKLDIAEFVRCDFLWEFGIRVSMIFFFFFRSGMVRPTDEEKIACYSQVSEGARHGALWRATQGTHRQGWCQVDGAEAAEEPRAGFQRESGQRGLCRLSWLPSETEWTRWTLGVLADRWPWGGWSWGTMPQRVRAHNEGGYRSLVFGLVFIGRVVWWEHLLYL